MLAKKCLFVVILTLFGLSLVMAQDPPAVHPKTGDELVIDCLRGTVTIDGDLSDWNLGSMTPAVLDTPEQLSSGQTTWDNPKDSSGEFYLLWDDVNIYIAVVMKDDKLSQNKTGGSIWNADGIEVFFSTLNAVSGHDEHYQYGFDFKEQTWNWCNMDSGGQSAIDYLQVASSITGDGYICEASIEYGQMLSLDFSVGNTIGFHPVFDDTDIDDGDRELQMTWTGRPAHDQSQGFGYLVLSDATAGDQPQARRPNPKDGALIEETWVNLSWSPGDFAVSHDIYIGDDFDEVDTGSESTFVGNQTGTFIVVGFPGFPIPDGLVPGTTYYWRIDEVNEAEPNSPWKGNIWSFSVPPKTAYFPDPADGADSVDVDVQLNWTAGYGAKLHTVYFGETFEEVDNATGGSPQGTLNYSPGTLKMAKTYYWRVDEFDVVETYKGDVWSFTTEGAVRSPNPTNGAEDVSQTPVLTWVPGVFADTHEVFFGTDPAALELKGSGNLGEEDYEPGQLEWNTTYYWRVDEANNADTDSPWTGPLWSFTTANFLIVDDFESYNDLDPTDPDSNRIFNAWIDGYDDPTNGSLVGYDNPPFAEQTIVHGGNQSMPMSYDNAVGKSEATLTLTSNRDWTVNGVNTLTIWFRGDIGNAAENLYVALNGNARVDNDNPDAATLTSWTPWNIDLQAFADQGVNLANVNSITLGLSSVTGGTGMMYFDDIRLYPPAQ
ncbi:MAG: sugar-binding protein [Phycisphaerae bacterium]